EKTPLQCTPNRRHREGERLAPLAFRAASVTHCEVQAVQIEALLPQRFQKTIGLLVVEVIDLGHLVGDLLHRLGVGNVFPQASLELDFGDETQVIPEYGSGALLDLRREGQQVFQGSFRIDLELKALGGNSEHVNKTNLRRGGDR